MGRPCHGAQGIHIRTDPELLLLGDCRGARLLTRGESRAGLSSALRSTRLLPCPRCTWLEHAPRSNARIYESRASNARFGESPYAFTLPTRSTFGGVLKAFRFAMKVSDFDFVLPPHLIAQSPARPRDSARLLVLDRQTGRVSHGVFQDLPQHLRPGDVLVLNETRVFPARLRAGRPSGAAVEVLLLRPRSDTVWEALIKPGRRVRRGVRLVFSPGVLEGI
ncbi:MAG TPA: S-adenosylmethionine:tRNA ribosyltransferase-isomerase, partial [bacterium]|nr:S-adenosylmethionine:tRNA ribosyltransferase-isomerase [bacterium]